MIEADLETRIIQKITGLLEEAGIENIQTTGSFAVSAVKAIAESNKDAYIVVKVSPRSYATPTVPEATWECGISLTVRADIDYNGSTYLDLCNMLMTQFETWQKCQEDAHDDFTVEGLNMTGFVLGNGTTGIDQTATAFSYTHTFTIYGITV